MDTTKNQTARAESEREVFGDNPVRGPDGEPMERGHGSRFAAMSPAAKAHFHAVASADTVEQVLSLSKQLTDATAKLAREHKAMVEAVTAAKVDAAKAAPPVEPKPEPVIETDEQRKAREGNAAEAARQSREQAARETIGA
jgi:hypothetical protein